MIDKDGVLRLGKNMKEIPLKEDDREYPPVLDEMQEKQNTDERIMDQLRVLQKNFQKWADENSAQARDVSSIMPDCDRSYYNGVAHGLREASNYIASLL